MSEAPQPYASLELVPATEYVAHLEALTPRQRTLRQASSLLTAAGQIADRIATGAEDPDRAESAAWRAAAALELLRRTKTTPDIRHARLTTGHRIALHCTHVQQSAETSPPDADDSRRDPSAAQARVCPPRPADGRDPG